MLKRNLSTWRLQEDEMGKRGVVQPGGDHGFNETDVEEEGCI